MCLLTIDVCIKELLSNTAFFSILRTEAKLHWPLCKAVFRSAILVHDAAANQHYSVSAQGGHEWCKDSEKNIYFIMRKKYNSLCCKM
jgi:hypothetical protein